MKTMYHHGKQVEENNPYKNLVRIIINNEVKLEFCMSCGDYGHDFSDCPKCHFSKLPKHVKEKIYRSFFD
jgi:ribosomal protein L32